MEIFGASEKLYKRDSSGGIRVWWAETGFDENDQFYWRTCSGTDGGKIIESGWKAVKQKNVGKANETSLQEQAVSEMTSKAKKKRDTGYFVDKSMIDTFDKVKPMLASGHDKHKYDYTKNMYLSQPKLDGIRCIATKDGLWTRSGERIVSLHHIENALKPVFDKDPDFKFDGELYNHQLRDNFNKITSLVRKQDPTDNELKEITEFVEYHVYDAVDIPESLGYGGKDNKPMFSDRYYSVKSVLSGIKYIELVPTVAVKDSAALDALYEKYMEAGYEGQMIRIQAVYENKRSKYLLKRKE